MTGSDTGSQAGPEASTPVLRVVNPDATPEEVAALVAVFSALGPAAPEAPKRRSLWASPGHRVRVPLHPGPGAWRASGLPG
ncbi:acyl-CoA carboxylase subunit epsilon [Nocardioides insulae]|uniref:acyl-CoA carboxylase subunit epsilon n=1 Tax=Nocardioides insulae TaxID=394734 RepID=UPI00040C4939|nr:acyl-CoA carboxylase subunit epsilon [Nocardioides insulae]